MKTNFWKLPLGVAACLFSTAQTFALTPPASGIKQSMGLYISKGYVQSESSYPYARPVMPANGKSVQIFSDPKKKYQKIWGFGASITDACLSNMKRLSEERRQLLMDQFFSRSQGAGFSYLRVPLGSNDFSVGDYSLNDTTDGQADPQLKKFNFSRMKKIVEFVKEAKAINPELKIMLSPWSPPAWMKNTKNLRGGQLEKKYYASYALYIKKALIEFAKNGININHLTVLNEPLIGDAIDSWGFPQAFMSTEDQTKFISEDLSPELAATYKAPKILLHDHNWDNSGGVNEMMKNPKVRKNVAGVAYHCYGGDFNAQVQAFKDKPGMAGFNSECSATQNQGSDEEIFNWWLKNQSLDSLRIGSSGALGWNLCLDEKGGPRNNGCEGCRGLVTVDHSSPPKVIFNPEFHALAQASRDVESGARRIETNDTSQYGIVNVGFQNPDGTQVIMIRNDSAAAQNVVVQSDPLAPVTSVIVPSLGVVNLKFERYRVK